ncbi:MAG: YncE family protein [Chloroflexi bacterium]|nr:YncE family protein [Chloroflexota bacterium]
MSLKHVSYVDLPEHIKPGGFDHAAVHAQRNRLYVAHTANDSVDVIDCREDRYLHSIPNLMGVAGALVAEADDLVFTSNRDENTVGIFKPDEERGIRKINAGIHPNGLAYDANSGQLLVAHVGTPDISGSTTVSIINVAEKQIVATLPVPGRTRWAIFDATSSNFYVNIADPPEIMVIPANQPDRIARTFSIPVAGPHGLDIDSETQRLFCACDGGELVVLDAGSGMILHQEPISGNPDVIFFNAKRQHLYIAVGNPGVIDVFDTHQMRLLETVNTQAGAHTLGFDPVQNKIYAFLPQTHQAAVYVDEA